MRNTPASNLRATPDALAYLWHPGEAPRLAEAIGTPDAQSDFAREMIQGLARRPRSVPPKFFYDQAGSALFDRICELPEYYPTRTEIAILSRHAGDIAGAIGPQADVVEFGAGSVLKIRILLDALESPRRFVPIDISAEHLHAAADGLRRDYPGLDVQPIAADFTRPLTLPPALPLHRRGNGHASAPRVGFFPGSSIGNFTPEEALRFLHAAAQLLRGGGLLIGVDLVKDPAILHAAYNDAQGVTAAFNRNLLVRANRELGATFDPERFAHYAFYDPMRRRIEMHLVSVRMQGVRLCGRHFELAEGESLHTENSCKYTVEGFRQLAAQAGFVPEQVWCDPDRLFSVHWLVAPG